MGILSQLGDLFLAAVPTVIVVFLFYFFLRWSFFTPIQRVLSERHKRAEGARREAEASRAAMQQKLRAYNDALRKARAEVFAEQEAIRRGALDERQGSISAARVAAQNDLQTAKKSLAEEVESVRVQLEQSSATLAGEIAESILVGGPSGPGRPGNGGAR